jgi:hypothetical protein
MRSTRSGLKAPKFDPLRSTPQRVGVHGALDLEPAAGQRMLTVDGELGCPVLVAHERLLRGPSRTLQEAAEQSFDDEHGVPIDRLGSAAERSLPVGR